MTFTIAVTYDNNPKMVFPGCTVAQMDDLIQDLETAHLTELKVVKDA
jgi:hypothetical protein